VSETSRLFADLPAQLEDMHRPVVDGRASGQPPEVPHSLADALCNGLQRTARIPLDIRLSLQDV